MIDGPDPGPPPTDGQPDGRSGDLPVDGPLPGSVPDGHEHGLERWAEHVAPASVCWLAPAGTTATLEVAGEGADAAQLQWSTRCAQVPSTRAVVLAAGPGSGDQAAEFTSAHLAAENVAEFVTAHSGVEAGPIEVLVFRPDADSAWPEPTPTPDGAEFRFRHRGGADVHLTLTLPTAAEKGLP